MAGLELQLTDEQGALLEARLDRAFDTRNAETITRKIENAATTEELVNIARELQALKAVVNTRLVKR